MRKKGGKEVLKEWMTTGDHPNKSGRKEEQEEERSGDESDPGDAVEDGSHRPRRHSEPASKTREQRMAVRFQGFKKKFEALMPYRGGASRVPEKDSRLSGGWLLLNDDNKQRKSNAATDAGDVGRKRSWSWGGGENNSKTSVSKALAREVSISMRPHSDGEEDDEERGGDDSDDEEAEAILLNFLRTLKEPCVNIDSLRAKVMQHGVPSRIRASVWLLLLGYWPKDESERASHLLSKREEYLSFAEQYLSTDLSERSEEDVTLLKQVQVDIPRTSARGLDGLMKNESMQALLERVLYIYALRNPDVNYFQGLNEVCLPFLVVLVELYHGEPVEEGNIEEALLKIESSPGALQSLEADTFWCLSYFFAAVKQDFSITPQGLGGLLEKLEQMVKISDERLYAHLTKIDVEFVHFALRWIICLLTREMDVYKAIELWDWYLCIVGFGNDYNSNSNSLMSFHLCVCAAFLSSFSEDILRADMGFHEAILFLQNLSKKTHYWRKHDVKRLLKRAKALCLQDQALQLICNLLCAVVLVAMALALLLMVLSLVVCLCQGIARLDPQQLAEALSSLSFSSAAAEEDRREDKRQEKR
ncbi:GTPase-activating protein [Balamuthia mandrillaris]